jgi:hypothetical protein
MFDWPARMKTFTGPLAVFSARSCGEIATSKVTASTKTIIARFFIGIALL